MNQHRFLTTSESIRVRALVESSYSAVARRVDLHRTTVRRAVSRFRDTGSDCSWHGQGSPRVTNKRDDQFLRLSTMRNRAVTSSDLQVLARNVFGLNISA
ncbi:hypothetical protein J6590_031853 [Homalodisca vitripennis]|nr:hypothetical protein J6590_031853 [Homalodisca vitripennis]